MKLSSPLPRLAALAAAACLAPLAQAQSTVYDSYGPLGGSISYGAFGLDQVGGYAVFGGTDRQLTDVTVRMASQTTVAAGAPYNLSMTLSIYNVGPAGAVGAFLGSMTQTFAIPSSPQPNQSSIFDVTFTFPSMLMLPGSVIWALGFNPGPNGAPQNSLNIGVTESQPAVGAAGNRDLYYSAVDSSDPQSTTIQHSTVLGTGGTPAIAIARFNAIPEPSVAVLAGAGLLALAFRVRRRG